MAHIGLHHIQPKVVHHLAQLLHTLLIGGNLGFQVGHVLLRVAARVLPTLQQRHHLGLAQYAAINELEQLLICTPSSSMRVENGGIEPGVVPPMSAWWPRLPT
jgi:hypothetical protein